VLLALNAIRLIWRQTSFTKDLADFERGPGYFTMAAGLAIVGSQMRGILNYPRIALALWVASLALWVCFNYAIFVEVTINEQKPRFEDGINGGWLISVVAMQAVATLAAELYGEHIVPAPVLFLALILWLAGGMLYIWLIALIFYRFTFFRFKPQDFLPPFWINMGAMAVSAVAGVTLVANAQRGAFLGDLLPFIEGLTLLFWATASWWIPMLAILACWQHLIKKINRPYSPLYWSAVFPLGMYTVATYELSQTMNLPFLMWIPRVFVYIALAAWAGTLASMLHSMWTGSALERDLAGWRWK
jgi:tellurite resistance protein TehA-like permease